MFAYLKNATIVLILNMISHFFFSRGGIQYVSDLNIGKPNSTCRKLSTIKMYFKFRQLCAINYHFFPSTNILFDILPAYPFGNLNY